MMRTTKIFLTIGLATGFSQILPAQVRQNPKVVRSVPLAPLTPRERALQMLNRFTYGPRPGEVDKVLQGSENWFNRQLEPATIPDSTLDKRLGDFPTLALTPERLLAVFPDRGHIEEVADGKRPLPSDPLERSVFEVEVTKLTAERGIKNHPPVELTEAQKAVAKKTDQATASRIAGLLFALPKKERMAAFNAMPPADRIAFANNVQGDQRSTLFGDLSPREREAVTAMQGGIGNQSRIYDELAQARELRQILSERQLQQVMTDFWFNHFNVFQQKDSDLVYTTAYERDVIRPHALGKFRDLLLATAQSPAMMIYLDNWASIGPNSLANGVDPAKPASRPGKKGLNENYGREIMELHTLGVNGGYTQADVTHLSAILTGWTVDRPNLAGPFTFDPKRHEPGPKNWLGYTISDEGVVTAGPRPSPAVAHAIDIAQGPGGMKQGLTALILLASSPRTAHFISFELAQRFVADQPPAAVVDRLAAVYMASDGDIKAILRALIASPEFNSRQYFRNRVKMPAEFVASAFRATGTDPQDPGAIVNLLSNQLGEAPYRKLEPTGYYITADHWMNTQSLLSRLNFADQLTHNHFANQKFDSSRLLAIGLMNDGSASSANGAGSIPASLRVNAFLNEAPSGSTEQGPDLALHVLETILIGGEITPKTDRFIHSQLGQQPAANPAETLNLLTALLLGSPEFQLQ